MECSKDPRTVWVFGTPDEKWTKPCIQTYKKGKDVSLGVFGCFYGSKRGTFTPIVMKTVDMFLYKKILEQVVQPVYAEVDQKFDGKGIFMQDNAPYHTEAIPAIYLAVEDWNVMIWPQNSPDLNPIEHVWVRLKDKLQEHFPEVATMAGGAKTIKARLAEVLPLCWEMIEPEFFESLWYSMPARVEAVIEAEGWYTKY